MTKHRARHRDSEHRQRQKSYIVKGVMRPGWDRHPGTKTRGLLKAELRREIQEMSQ